MKFYYNKGSPGKFVRQIQECISGQENRANKGNCRTVHNNEDYNLTQNINIKFCYKVKRAFLLNNLCCRCFLKSD